MLSLFENNRCMNSLDVYLLGDNITNDNKELLVIIAKQFDRNIYFCDIPELNIPEIIISRRWPLCAFARLFSGGLLPDDLEVVMYLDCDTIISGSLSELDDYNMGNHLFCGVKDCIGSAYKKNIGLSGNAPYINAGVLLINLKKLRTIDVKVKLESYLKMYISYINYADQDLLNGIFYKDIGIISPKFNLMTIVSVYSYEELLSLRKPTNYYEYSELRAAIDNPAVIHYTTNMLNIRPWYNNTNHPLANEFTKFLYRSSWKDTMLSDYRFTSFEAIVIRSVLRLPKVFAYKLLGIIHSDIKPFYIKMKAKKI